MPGRCARCVRRNSIRPAGTCRLGISELMSSDEHGAAHCSDRTRQENGEWKAKVNVRVASGRKSNSEKQEEQLRRNKR